MAQAIEKTEPQAETFDLKALMSEMKSIKEKLATLTAPAEIAKPKGAVEESFGATEARASIREKFKAFLKSGSEVKEWKVSEAIPAQTASSAIPAMWTATPEILSPEGADGYFLTSVVTWKDDVKGKPGNIVYVQTVAPVAYAAITSGTEPTFSAATVSTVPVVLAQLGHGFYITKNDLEDVQDGTLDALIEQSKLAIMRGVDGTFLSNMFASANNFGAGTVAAGGVMGATTLASAWGSMTAGSYKPAAVGMHPVQYASLLKDQQFTNAAWRGNGNAIESGVLGRYLGMDIVPLIQGTLVNTGTYKAVVFAKGACVGAIKRDFEVEKEYYVKDQRNYVNVSIRFGGTVVHTNGIGLITSVNG